MGKKAEIWIFTPHFSKFEVFWTLQPPKRHVFIARNKWLKKALMHDTLWLRNMHDLSLKSCEIRKSLLFHLLCCKETLRLKLEKINRNVRRINARRLRLEQKKEEAFALEHKVMTLEQENLLLKRTYKEKCLKGNYHISVFSYW